MFIAINNVSKMIKVTPLLKQECVTIKLFGLRTQILATDIAIFFVGLVVTIILAELLANYMIANIEELKKRKMRDLYLKQWKERKEINKVLKQKIIQCDKCYNEYGETEIKRIKLFGDIFQQYCSNCHNSRSEGQGNIKKSQSDSKFNYSYGNN